MWYLAKLVSDICWKNDIWSNDDDDDIKLVALFK